jgi:Peptidase A4 family
VTGAGLPGVHTARTRRRRVPAAIRLPGAVLLSALLLLAAAPAALADTTESANWAGYAAHRSGVEFKKVVATWRQPSASCSAGNPTFSSIWIGLGGYSLSAQALEQIGSEVDCTIDGQVVSTAWYEIVPAPSHTLRMTVAPGDQLSASVIVTGHQVRLALSDLTRHRSFTRTVHAGVVDVSSAEWILEAPSECAGTSQCQILNLADFGTATFARARATTTSGHTGSLSDRRWRLTKIILSGGQRRFIASASTQGQATPSALTAGGSAFTIAYRSSAPTTTTQANAARAATVSAVARMRPGGARRR